MSGFDHSEATLRIFGADLVPEEITASLGASPTATYRRGDVRPSARGNVYVEKTGSWRLSATRHEPENLEAQIFEILDQLTSDLAIWRSIGVTCSLDIFCGIFMASGNDGMELSPRAMVALGERGISLGLDIYDSSGD